MRLTVVPAGPAMPLSVTCPAVEFPPTTELGVRVTACRTAGLTASVAVCVCPAKVAVIVEVEDAETAAVLTVNVAEVAPLLTVIDAGTIAQALFEERLTVAVLAPTGDAKVTVPVDIPPPTTLAGDNVSNVKGG
jgi:hypothetical protein